MTRSYLTPGWLIAYAVGAMAWVGVYALTGWLVWPILALAIGGVVAFWRWIVTERYVLR